MEKYEALYWLEQLVNIKNGSDSALKLYNATNKKRNEIGQQRVEDDLKNFICNNLNAKPHIGIEPELFALGVEFSVGYIKEGVIKFPDFAKRMIENMGDVILPYLKSFYEAARYIPSIASSGENMKMTSYEEVRDFDLSNLNDAFSRMPDTIEMKNYRKVRIAKSLLKNMSEANVQGLISSTVKLGYGIVLQGYCKYEEWMLKMYMSLYNIVKEHTSLSDNDVKLWLEDVWNCSYMENGEVKTIQEWSEHVASMGTPENTGVAGNAGTHDTSNYKPKDNTKFSIDGKYYYHKNKFPLIVIKKYVADHPNVTLVELERLFPSKIISKERGVVRSLDIVKQWIKENPDVAKRYCLNEDEIICLHNGEKVVVHNQWGTKHFPRFLKIAKSLFNVRSDKPYEYELTNNMNLKTQQGIEISQKSLEAFLRKK